MRPLSYVALPLAGVVTVLGGVLAAQVVTAPAAVAHAELESSSPADKSAVPELPGTVSLTFTEAVGRPAQLQVLDPRGEPVQDGELQVTDATVEQAVDSSGAMAGEYTVSYQVTSADGHPITGTVTFVVGQGGGAAPAAPDADDSRRVWVSAGLVALLAGGLAVGFVSLGRLLRRLPPGDPS